MLNHGVGIRENSVPDESRYHHRETLALRVREITVTQRGRDFIQLLGSELCLV